MYLGVLYTGSADDNTTITTLNISVTCHEPFTLESASNDTHNLSNLFDKCDGGKHFSNATFKDPTSSAL